MKFHLFKIITGVLITTTLNSFAQTTWKANPVNTDHKWTLIEQNKPVKFESTALVFKTLIEEKNTFLHPLYSDFSKKISISLKTVPEPDSYGGYTFYFNSSSNARNRHEIEVTDGSVSLKITDVDSRNYYLKVLGKQKIKKFKASSDHQLDINIDGGKITVTISYEGQKLIVYDGDFLQIKDAYFLGFKEYQYKNFTSELKIAKLEASYSPNELISVEKNGLDLIGEKENLGDNINSKYDELAPIISADGKFLYFTRQDKGADEDHIYESRIENETLSTAVKSGLNFTYYNSIISISPDNNKAYLKGYFKNGEWIKKGISYSYRNGSRWLTPIGVDIKGYKNKDMSTSNFVSSDGRIIISSIKMQGGLGEKDLYVSLKDDQGEFSELIHLGEVINSSSNDGTPFLSSDNQTLYFSSNGHGGYGDADIFMTKRLDDTWQYWSKPVNLGPKINSTNYDAYFSITAKGDYGYFVSYDNSLGEADIFRVKINDEKVKPEPVILLSGRVLDVKSNAPIESKIIYKDLKTGKIIGAAQSDKTTGNYQLVLPYKSNYAIYAESKNYYAKRDTINLVDLKNYNEVTKDLFLQKMEVGKPIRLNNIFFETAKATLLPESFDELNNLIELLRKNTSIKIKINGHTDNVGNDNDNLELSKKRALSVLTYLTQKGIDESRLQYEGYGETNPLNDNLTSTDKQQNRRVEFVILSN